ncbi:conserved hypothetical protein [Ricinus communis]|uniref:U5 small nuclear ribonucleoprotein TSSC4 n=1 Tax=Ricinus communis TaxID=3988 RepID=B9RGX4_RICCO|nr:conserved hypothetical protein [Ricinus communis]|eukprot:XP_002512833.1 uncharacterized protein LOC8273098 [Ricinus communis]
MEDSFRVRVDKAFGSLASATSTSTAAVPPSSNLSALWSLTDDEIERNEWNRDKNSPEPETETDLFLFKKGSSSHNRGKSDVDLRLELEKDLDDLDYDDDELDDEQSRDGSSTSSSQLANRKPDDYNDEEWEIKNSIGLDCTLDYEEEEDQYDKVAVGREKAGDRLYMKDMTDYGINVDSSNEFPITFKDVVRDPRANHIAAKLRLKEDAEAAKKMDTLRVSEKDSPDIFRDHVKMNDDGNLKPILKRKDDESNSKYKNNQLDLKLQKRVRFDPGCKDGCDKESDEVGDVHMVNDSEDKSLVYPLPPDYPSGIPDYMRNPSKYTRYTFDSSTDVDEQSNRQAFKDFLKMLKKTKGTDSQPDDASGELPKSVTFVPKRKVGDSEMVDSRNESKQNQDSLQRRGLPISIPAADAEDSKPSAMDEDEPETATDKRESSQRAGRKYRAKVRPETEDPV